MHRGVKGKVVHVGLYDPMALDGVSITLVGQCEALRALGVDVEVWTFRCECKRVTMTTTESGITMYNLGRYKNPVLAAVLLPKSTRQWVASRLKEIGCFHLHSVFSPAHNLLGRMGVPFVVTPNGGWGEAVLRGRRAMLKSIWIFFFEANLWKKARFVQAVSRVEEEHLTSLPGIARTVYIRNGVDAVADSGPSERKNFLFLGRLAVEQKGLDLLLRAYAEFAKGVSDVPRLRLVGPDFRGGLKVLGELAKDLGISQWVDFVGPLSGDQKREAIFSAALFLHPSRWEGMPLAILEALAHGVPCLVSPQTGMAEWIVDNNCGWAVSGEIGALAAMLRKLHDDPQGLKQAAGNTRACVSRDYAWTNIADELKRQYGMDDQAVGPEAALAK